jgi:hypothetical protein
MHNLFVGVIIGILVLLLPAMFCFKNRSEFLSCFSSFMYVGNSRITKTHENRSIKFALYFTIVLFGSLMTLMLFV